MKTDPQKEHQWLQKLLGEWSYDAEASMGPEAAPMKSKGTETVRSLGGLWVIGESTGQLPDGSPAMTMLTLGYDPMKQRFVGTWIGSMMTHMWVYNGTLNESGNVLTLDTEGPGMTGEGIYRYQDIVEFKSDSHRVLSSRVLGDDGNWKPFMTANYRRV
jgi:hypothetical protein